MALKQLDFIEDFFREYENPVQLVKSHRPNTVMYNGHEDAGLASNTDFEDNVWDLFQECLNEGCPAIGDAPTEESRECNYSQYSSSPSPGTSVSSLSPSSTQEIEADLKSCRVCFKPTRGHFFYGGRCCHSCRAFFKRSVLSRGFNAFRCRTSLSSCTIDSNSWQSCQACRFRACLAAGMRPELVTKRAEISGATKRRKSKNPVWEDISASMQRAFEIISFEPGRLRRLPDEDQAFLHGQVCECSVIHSTSDTLSSK